MPSLDAAGNRMRPVFDFLFPTLVFLSLLLGWLLQRYAPAVCRWLAAMPNLGFYIWASYMYLHPVASVGAGCYVLWQNIINSLELWQYKRLGSTDISI